MLFMLQAIVIISALERPLAWAELAVMSEDLWEMQTTMNVWQKENEDLKDNRVKN